MPYLLLYAPIVIAIPYLDWRTGYLARNEEQGPGGDMGQQTVAMCSQKITTGGTTMTLCPIALTAGCKKCPVFSVCPLKTVIGDQEKPDTKQSRPRTGASQGEKDKG